VSAEAKREAVIDASRLANPAAGDVPLVSLLAGSGTALALRVPGVIDPAEARAWADGVAAARASWVEAFGGAQFSLGRAWYTHLEQGRAAAYFDDVASSDREVERVCPGLQSRMRALASQLTGAGSAGVTQREGWCGPGVHVFPHDSPVARRGGDIHYDTEGLTPAHAADRAPAFTLVLMLQPATRNGGLAVWDARYRGTDAYEDDDLERDRVVCPYGPGDLVVIDSYRLHQIQPFEGTVDRISATCHLAFVEGRWEAWF